MATWITYTVEHRHRQTGGGYGPIAGSMTDALTKLITALGQPPNRFRVVPTGDGGMIATYRTYRITIAPAPEGIG